MSSGPHLLLYFYCTMMKKLFSRQTNFASNISKRRSTSISGRATLEATKAFVQKSGLKLFHQFNTSGLYVTPVIHGSPSEFESLNDRKYADILLKRAIMNNKSNCIVVYHCHDNPPTETSTDAPKVWSTTGLSELLLDSQYGLKREELVVGANLGHACSTLDIYNRLSEASRLTNLEYFDFAFVKISDAVLKHKPHYIKESFTALQNLCEDEKMQFFGLEMNIIPYIYHSPILKSFGEFSPFPSNFEEDLAQHNSAFADLVIYPVSPTIGIPTTYPMLDPSPDKFDISLIGERGADLKRRFTRAASHALTCVRGLGDPNGNEDEESIAEMMRLEEERQDSRDQSSNLHGISWYLVEGLIEPPADQLINSALDHLCPRLASTPLLQEKALRCVFSVGMDLVMLESEVSAALGPLRLEPQHMLSSLESDAVFGTLAMPDLAALVAEDRAE